MILLRLVTTPVLLVAGVVAGAVWGYARGWEAAASSCVSPHALDGTLLPDSGL